MRLAIVTVFPDTPSTICGGVAGVSRYLTEPLKKEPGLEIDVIVPKSGVGGVKREDWDGLKVYRLGKLKLLNFLPGTIYDIFWGKHQVTRLLEQLSPDIVHYQGETFLAAGCSLPNVLTIHGIGEQDARLDGRWGRLWPLRWLVLKLTEEYGRRRARNLILISGYVRRFLPEKVKGRKIWRIDNPVEDSFFELKRRARPGRVLCCGRVIPRKNIVGLIRSFAAVARQIPYAELRIAGAPDTAYLRECGCEADLQGLAPKVSFLGELTINELQAELVNAGCLAIPSFQETAPLAVGEAMAAGVPVVGAAVGGLPELIENGRTGFLVNPHDIQGLADALVAVLSDAELAAAMSERAREIAEGRFRASLVGKRTYEVYREIIG